MNRFALRFGLYAAAILVLTVIGPFIYMVTSGSPSIEDMAMSEIFGYSVMIVAELLVLLAIKAHRDRNLNGVISYGKALGVGALTAAVSGVIFGFFSWICYEFINPEFMETYYVESMRMASESQEQFAKMMEEYNSYPGWMKTAWFGGITMAITVSFIGLVISAIGSVFLRKSA